MYRDSTMVRMILAIKFQATLAYIRSLPETFPGDPR